MRLIVRRVRLTPGSQLALFVEFSYHGLITDPFVIADVFHRVSIQLDARAPRALTTPVRMYVDYIRVYR